VSDITLRARNLVSLPLACQKHAPEPAPVAKARERKKKARERKKKARERKKKARERKKKDWPVCDVQKMLKGHLPRVIYGRLPGPGSLPPATGH